MIGLCDVTRVHLPRRLIESAMDHLRHVGRQGCEGFAVWAGTLNSPDFEVTHTIIPQQKAIRSRDGICVVVEPDGLHQLNVWLYENGCTLLAQIHSHPGEAYHSGTDDDFPVVTIVGGLSLVVPDFAIRPFSLDTTAVYRLSPTATWEELTISQVRNLIQIT